MPNRVIALLVAAIAVIGLSLGCERERQRQEPAPTPPAQQTVDDAMAQAAAARNETVQERRLRDIERMRMQGELATASSHTAFYRWLLLAGTAVVLLAIIWLAREVRMRRVLVQVIKSASKDHKGGAQSANTDSPGEDTPPSPPSP